VNDVFVSYSRQFDSELVDRLASALGRRGQDAWVDREDIFPSSRWRPEIEKAILEAHAFLFVISPGSVESEYCRAELQRAVDLGKRIVPVLARPTAIGTVPAELRDLHFLSLAECQGADDQSRQAFEAQVDRLVEVLTTDIGSLHLHTRLLTQSTRWEQEKQDRSLLLRGRELERAERWLDEQVASRRNLLPQQQRLIRESRRAATRRQRGSATVAVLVALVMIVLAATALVQRGQAVHQSDLALSGELAAESVSEGYSSVTLQGLLSLQAYDRAPTVQARSSVVGAMEQPLQTVLHSSLSEVNGVAYDPNGQFLAAACKYGLVVWDMTTGQARLVHETEQVNGVSFSANGALLAGALSSGYVGLFSAPDFDQVGVVPAGLGPAGMSPVVAVAFSPQRSELAAVTDGGAVTLWSVGSARQHVEAHELGAVAAGDVSLLSVSFDPAAELLAVAGGVNLPDGGSDAIVEELTAPPRGPALQRVASFQETGSGSFNHVAYSPRGNVLAGADSNGLISLFSSAKLPTSGELPRTGKFQLASDAEAVSFSPSGALLATSDSQGAVQLWGPTSLVEVGPPMQDGSIVYGLAFSPDGRYLASGDEGGDVVMWSGEVRMPGTRAISSPSYLLELSINSDSRLLATVNASSQAEVWDLDRRAHAAPVEVKEPTSVTFSPRQAGALAVGSYDGDVALYDVATHRSALLAGNPKDPVSNTIFSPDGGQLAVFYVNQPSVTLWDVRSRAVVGQFSVPHANPGWVSAAAFSPDGKELVVAYTSWGLEVFHTRSPKAQGTVINLNEVAWSLAFSPDGSVLAAGDNYGNVELFDGPNFHPAGTLFGEGSAIYTEAVSPDGRTLATVDGTGHLQLWDLPTDQKLGTAVYLGQSAFAADFAPNGELLATGNMAGTVVLWPSLLWGTDVKAFSAELCPRLAGNLTPVQWDEYAPHLTYQRTCPGYPAG
jgi:WD40 repeat protein